MLEIQNKHMQRKNTDTGGLGYLIKNSSIKQTCYICEGIFYLFFTKIGAYFYIYWT